MPLNEAIVLDVAALVAEAVGLGDAVLANDLDEARFRARLIVAQAGASGYSVVAKAAADLVHLLGSSGSVPMPGYGAGILNLAEALDAIGVSSPSPDDDHPSAMP